VETVEKQPTPDELERARERARTDAEERYACEASGREPSDVPGEVGPYAFAAEALQAEYERAYEGALAELRARRG
jgi:hypothetical protein